MKTSRVIGPLVLILFFIAASGRAQEDIQLGFRFTGGLNYLAGGDLQKAMEGAAAQWEGIYAGAGLTAGGGEYRAFHNGLNFGGEIVLQFSARMGLGLGVDTLQASAASEYDYAGLGLTFQTYWKPEVSAVPISLNYYYYLPLGGRLKIVFHGGLGYYLARLKLEDQFWFGADIQEVYDTHTSGLGFHGGLGLEVALFSRLALLVEVRGRWANFGGFQGEGTLTIPSTSYSRTESGTFFYYKSTVSGLGTFDNYDFSEGLPAWSGVSDARELRVDFSGYSLAAGFMVRL